MQVHMISKDIIIISIASAYVLSVVCIPVILQERGIISKKARRRIIHSLAGISVIIVPFLKNKWPAVLFAAIMTAAVILSNRKTSLRPLKGLYESIAEESEEVAQTVALKMNILGERMAG